MSFRPVVKVVPSIEPNGVESRNLDCLLEHLMDDNETCSLLASLYQTAREAIGVARRANLPIQFVDAEGAAIVVWGSILVEARKRDMLSAIESVVTGDYPGLDFGRTLRASPAHVGTGRAGIDLRLLGSASDYEKITGTQPTFLPTSFLATGLVRARCVVRIVCDNDSYGSGFLIEQNLLVTNHHVLGSVADAERARVDFGYELAEQGTIRAPVSFHLNPAQGFLTSERDDWTVVRLEGNANQDWGAIPLTSAETKAAEFVNIIQHPGGGPKQIALYHNVVVFADGARVQYLTDTMPGSSGSPVFDSSWQLVAIHHAGGWLKSPNSKDARFCNEGIAAKALIEGLSQLLS